MHSIKNVIDSIFSHFDDSLWQYNLIKNWNSIAGDFAATTFIKDVTTEKIIIGVYNYRLISQLYMISSEILREVNKFLIKYGITIPFITFIYAKPTI